jgi:uncharacterized protein (TIGR01777 family)
MKIHEFVRRSEMPVTSSVLFDWHARPGALQRLLPPWEPVRIVRAADDLEKGRSTVLKVPVGPLRLRWVARFDEFREGESFRDVQDAGPFALWEHTHRVESIASDRSVLEDRIRYALPFGAVGDRLAAGLVRRRLERMFDFRHERMRLDLQTHERFESSGPQRILISGASGLVGSELVPFLSTGGDRIVPLSRSGHFSDTVRWSPADGRIETEKLPGFDAVVHLAGENIFGRWTAAKKHAIRSSRVDGTRLLCESLAALPRQDRPQVFVAASAIGFYGDGGDDVITEQDPDGIGFLADVCREWEAACEPARQAGIRVVNMRFGAVLTPRGGLLGTLLPLFKAGLGGRVGNGRQWMSWIAVDDLVDLVKTAMCDENLTGPVNATAPHPVTNAEFTQTLARVVRRPALLPVPAFGAKIALGAAADELALSSARVVPARMQQQAHHFRYPALEPALRFLLGRD